MQSFNRRDGRSGGVMELWRDGRSGGVMGLWRDGRSGIGRSGEVMGLWRGLPAIGRSGGLMRLRTGVWAIGLLLVGFASCKQPEAPEYYGFQNLQIGAATGAQTTVSTVVKLYNPNPYNLELKRAEVDVSVNGRHAGHSLLDSTIHIPRRDTFYVPISVQVDLQAMMSNALQMLLSKEATVSLDGRVKIKKGMLTFNRSFHYDGKQDLNALLQQGF